MKEILTKQQIGKRIMELRKAKGLRQDDLAKTVGLSRPSLVQIELGNRSVEATELMGLSGIFGYSMDEMLSADFSLKNEPASAGAEKRIIKERKSVPDPKPAKWKNVLLYLLERCAGKPNVSEPMLNVLLYFCDFNFYEMYEEHLTGARYRKLAGGPVPHRIDVLLQQMLEQGQLKRLRVEYNGQQQTRYLPLQKSNLKLLSAAEKAVMDHVVDQMSDWSAAKAMDYALRDMPCLTTKQGEYISYNLAFYRELPYAVRFD